MWLQLHDAIYRPHSIVLMPRCCANYIQQLLSTPTYLRSLKHIHVARLQIGCFYTQQLLSTPTYLRPLKHIHVARLLLGCFYTQQLLSSPTYLWSLKP